MNTRYLELQYNAFDQELKCDSCKQRFGEHCGAYCPEGLGSGFTTSLRPAGSFKVAKPFKIVKPSKPKSRVAIAKDFQRQIAKLEAEQAKLYKQALRTLKIKDTGYSWDYFYNDMQGYSSFLESL